MHFADRVGLLRDRLIPRRTIKRENCSFTNSFKVLNMKRRNRGILGLFAALVAAVGGSVSPGQSDVLQSIAMVVLAVLSALPDKDGDGTPDILEKR
jgi:hypothetical protein